MSWPSGRDAHAAARLQRHQREAKMSEDQDKKNEDGGADDGLDAKVQAAVEQAVTGLKSKNDELLGKNKTLSDKVNELVAKLAETEAGASEEKEKAARAANDIEALEKTLTERHTGELDGLKSQLAEREQQLNQLLIGNGLKAALVEANVGKAFMAAAEALLRSNDIKIEAVDGQPTATVDGKPLKEFVQAWSQSDEGKHFVSAGDNAGTGAKGADGGGSKAWTDYSSGELQRLKRDNPQQFQALKKARDQQE
ncbi:MAG: hypothetical protein AAF556_03275 [Pseudomonadota bacterium]